MENSKDLFVKAFLEAEKLDNAQLKKEEDIEWSFSKRFENSMNKLIKKNNRIGMSTRLKIRKGLIAAIIAIIVMFTGLMSVSATRMPFIEFIKKVFSQYNQITLSDESTQLVDTIETEYTLTDLPLGYVLDTYQKDEYSVFSIWKNNNNQEIVFSQQLLDTNFTIDNEHKYREIEINGNTAFYTEDENGAAIVWSDGYYWFTIVVPKDNINDIKNLQEKICKKIE